MLKSVWNDIVNYFGTGGIIARLILINIAVFVGVLFLGLFMGNSFGPSFGEFIRFFGVSGNLKYLAFHPWGLFTCMFLHTDFMHILFNMIWLYSFGRIAEDLLGEKRILSLYILGGLVGAISFVVSTQIIGLIGAVHPNAYALGASGAIMAITVAAGFLAPEYRISLIFFETKLKFIVVAILFLNIIGAFSPTGGGGTDHFGHLGGAFFGWLFVYLLRQGTDLSVPFNNFTDRIIHIFQRRKEAPRRPQPKVAFKNKEKIRRSQQPGRQSDYGSVQERIDAILDKISRQGMGSLTPEEQSFLHDYHNKLD